MPNNLSPLMKKLGFRIKDWLYICRHGRKWAIVIKVPRIDEDHYETVKVCDALSEANTLRQRIRENFSSVARRLRKTFPQIPCRDCQIVPYPSEQYREILKYSQRRSIGVWTLERWEEFMRAWNRQYFAAHIAQVEKIVRLTRGGCIPVSPSARLFLFHVRPDYAKSSVFWWPLRRHPQQ